MDGTDTTLRDFAAADLDDGLTLDEPTILGAADDPPAAPVAAAAPPAAPAEATTSAPDGLYAILGQYGKYVALFVGAGLISGAVVHFPLAPVRYGVIGAVGALLFAVASVITEREGKDTAAIARVAGAALALALGIGMISGSVQHFADVPERATVLIPIGLILSVAAFTVRHGLRPSKDDLVTLGLWAVVGAFALNQGLGVVAQRMGGGDGGHAHGETAQGPAAAPAEDAAHAPGAAHGEAAAKDDQAAAPAKDAAHAAEPAGHGEEAAASDPHGH